jgi:hypothetical protein
MSPTDLRSLGAPDWLAELGSLYPDKIGVAVVRVEGGKIAARWNGRCFDAFDGPAAIFHSLKRARSCIERAIKQDTRDGMPAEDYRLVLWIAPEHEWSDIPIDKYQLMSGWRLPGSPTA